MNINILGPPVAAPPVTAIHSVQHPVLTYLTFFLISWVGVRLSPLGTSATNWPIVPAPDMIDDECGAFSLIRIGKGNRRTRRKPALVPLRPPQIVHDLTELEPGPPLWEAGD
jgi:hypothetical protein